MLFKSLCFQVTLAARVDSFHESLDAKVGIDFLEEVNKKFEKWQEPPPVKKVITCFIDFIFPLISHILHA